MFPAHHPKLAFPIRQMLMPGCIVFAIGRLERDRNYTKIKRFSVVSVSFDVLVIVYDSCAYNFYTILE